MATNQTNVGTSHNLLNYSGLLFNKGNQKTPFSTSIGGKSRNARSWEFSTSVEYNPFAATTASPKGQGTAGQPSITETDSLTAPSANLITRVQNTNYCQIFQKKVSVSYAKTSSMGQLSGLNVAGAEANPASELDFQIAGTMQHLAGDIEYTFLNGTKQAGTYDDVAYKTQGIIGAISTNTTNASSAGLGYWLVAGLLQTMAGNYAEMTGLVLMTAPVHIMQLNADATNNGLTVIPAAREVNGIKISVLVTPFGDIGLMANSYVPAGTALIYNPAACAPVYLDVPGKGNMFLEPLAKVGAKDEYQIYGQIGLDYGAEYLHGKITSLATSFTAPTYSKKIYVAGGNVTIDNTTTAPVNTKEVTA